MINAVTATDEARACALNNRADIHDARGDLASAVADRTTLPALGETSYDRRYIAYSRRARTLWRLGEHDAALQDIDAILAMADIVMEQKMAARPQRAQWLMSTAPASVIADLETVIRHPGTSRKSPRASPLLLDQIQESSSDDGWPARAGPYPRPALPWQLDDHHLRLGPEPGQ